MTTIQTDSLYGSGVITSGELTEAERALLDNTATIRDGDDLLEVNLEPEEDDDDEGNPDEVKLETGKTPEDESVEELDPETGLPSDESIQTGLNAQNAAFEEHVKKVSEAGLDPEAIVTEYYKDGKLSAATYEGLQKAGYSKAAVDAIISGQEAQSQLFNNSIYAAVGGPAGFKQVAEFARANDPAGANAYNAAFERGDLATCKALLNSFKAQQTAKYGTANKGIQGAKPAVAPVGARAKAFESQSEMVKAMSDKRYGRDAKYTKEVEQRVAAS